MKKEFLYGLASIAFCALLMLNLTLVSRSGSTHLTLQMKSIIAYAQDENPPTKYQTKTVNTGSNATFYVTMNGLQYSRVCDYTQIICEGTGTMDCTPYFSTSNCTPWQLVNP